MATLFQSQPFDITVLANFQGWTGFIRTLFLTTGGWTQSSDTGQTNPTTVGSVPGGLIYEIYKASDTLAATTPIFVKIEYGQSNGRAAIGVTIGTGSNGTGTITGGGTRFVSSATNSAGTGSTTGYDCIGSADSGSVRFLMWRNNPSNAVPVFLAIEREKDNTGAATSNSFTLYYAAYAADVGGSSQTQIVFRQQTILSTGAGGNVEPAFLAFQTCLGSAGLGANVAAVPTFHMPGYIACASFDVLIGKQNDWAEASTNSITHYGTTHNYYCTKLMQNLGSVGGLWYVQYQTNNTFTASNSCLLFRYE
jgi:hypothetical protein